MEEVAGIKLKGEPFILLFLIQTFVPQVLCYIFVTLVLGSRLRVLFFSSETRSAGGLVKGS
jgi:hypothetical protein